MTNQPPTSQPTDATWQATTEAGRHIIDAIAQNPANTLVASDFDGTLADIVDDPEAAGVHPAARQALMRVGALVGQVAIITGRGLDSVRRLGQLDGAAGLEHLLVKGQYGVETWDAATNTVTEPPLPPQVAQARTRVEGLLADLQGEGLDVTGVGLEDKGRALGVHTRRALDPQGTLDRLREPLQQIADDLGLHCEPGRLVIELRATPGTKAAALDEVLAAGSAQVAVMIGDDLADLTAFDRLHELQAQGLVVAAVASASSGEQPEVAARADVVCQGPAGVAAWLDAVADAVASARTAG